MEDFDFTGSDLERTTGGRSHEHAATVFFHREESTNTQFPGYFVSFSKSVSHWIRERVERIEARLGEGYERRVGPGGRMPYP